MKADLTPYFIDGFLPTIGIECHVQLRTKTKLFAAVAAEGSLQSDANSSVSPLCLGLPGALPVLNEAAVDLAISAGLALQAEIAPETSFDRKHYFYPDLPLGYQISQHWQPIITGGRLRVPLSADQFFEVGLERAHLEADAGKLTHHSGVDYSLLDLNRVGTPLLEIVSLPEMHSPAQAKSYAKELYLRMVYAQVCDGNLSAGNLRFDVNISISTDATKLGTRTEIKNLNSFRFIEKALHYEIGRQIALLKDGTEIIQETRGWNEAGRKTFSQRSKEDAQDYRYMPDPDIPPLQISRQRIAALQARLAIMPQKVRARLRDWEIPFATGEVLVEYPPLGELLLALPAALTAAQARLICNWLAGDVLALINQKKIAWPDVLAAQNHLQALASLKERSEISSTKAKEWLPQILKQKADPNSLLKAAGQVYIVDSASLKALIKGVFAQNPQAVKDARADSKAAGYLIGQVMKASAGKADPKLTAQLIAELLKS